MSSQSQPQSLPSALEPPLNRAAVRGPRDVVRALAAAEIPTITSIGLILVALLAITAIAAVIALRTRVSVGAVGWLYLLVVLPVTLRWGRRIGLTTAGGAAFLLLTFMTEPRGLPYTTNAIDIISLLLATGCIAVAVLLVHPLNAERPARDGVVAELIRSSTDVCLEATREGTIARWSAGAERLLGYEATQVLGKPLRMLLPQAQVGSLLAGRLTSASGERAPMYEIAARRSDGGTVDVSLMVSPMRADSGEGSVVLVLHDISIRKRVERAFREGDDILADAVTNLTNGLLILDQDGQVVLANAQAERLLSPTLDAGPRASFPDLFAPHYRLYPSQRWEEIARLPFRRLVALDTLDTTRGLSLELSRLDPQGAVHAVRYVLALRDATRELREARRRVPGEGRALPDGGIARPTAVLSDQQAGDVAELGCDRLRAQFQLTNRELEVLVLLTSGRSNQEIADALCITLNTAERHVANIYRKLHVRSRTHAAAYALQQGLIPSPQSESR